MSIRVVGLLKRRPDITHEEFISYWGTNHVRIFTSIAVLKKITLRYIQFHALTQQSAVLQGAGLSVAPFDGMAEFYVDSVEDILTMLSDDEFLKVALPDELNFLDRESMQVMIGEDHLKFENAKPVTK